MTSENRYLLLLSQEEKLSKFFWLWSALQFFEDCGYWLAVNKPDSSLEVAYLRTQIGKSYMCLSRAKKNYFSSKFGRIDEKLVAMLQTRMTLLSFVNVAINFRVIVFTIIFCIILRVHNGQFLATLSCISHCILVDEMDTIYMLLTISFAFVFFWEVLEQSSKCCSLVRGEALSSEICHSGRDSDEPSPNSVNQAIDSIVWPELVSLWKVSESTSDIQAQLSNLYFLKILIDDKRMNNQGRQVGASHLSPW